MRVTIKESTSWSARWYNPFNEIPCLLLSVQFDNKELAIIKHNGLENYAYFSGEWDCFPGKHEYFVKGLLSPRPPRFYPKNKLDVRLLHDQLNAALTKLKTMINNLDSKDPPSTTTFEI